MKQQFQPTFPGADVVYSRVYRIMEHINAQAYAAQVAVNKGRKLKRYTPPAESDYISACLAVADEEALKAIIHANRHIIGL